VATKKPDIIMIGGDLAYDNGLNSCYALWDLLFDGFKDDIFDKLGY